jgi:hypothetical protein
LALVYKAAGKIRIMTYFQILWRKENMWACHNCNKLKNNFASLVMSGVVQDVACWLPVGPCRCRTCNMWTFRLYCSPVRVRGSEIRLDEMDQMCVQIFVGEKMHTGFEGEISWKMTRVPGRLRRKLQGNIKIGNRLLGWEMIKVCSG